MQHPQLNLIVNKLRQTGKLPPALSLADESVQQSITLEQHTKLLECFNLFDQFMAANEKVEDIAIPDPRDKAQRTQLWLECRLSLQAAIIADLLRLLWVQES